MRLPLRLLLDRRDPAAERGRWPVELSGRTVGGESVRLRPLRRSDEEEFLRARADNAAWLRPWDATSPLARPVALDFRQYRSRLEAEATAGSALPFVIEHEDRIVGQLNVSSIIRGSFRSCTMGYWVIEEVAGRGFTPTAVALAGDHVLGELGLHRIEINVRPENHASLAVVRKLGLRDEGMRSRYLHIDGDWRDHRSFAVLAEEVGEGGLMGRLTS